jgi:capsular exopolysaccharide synthesis family protein
MITSPEPQEGKSNTAANLAAMIAQGGKKVFLVDADLRRPTIHKTFKIANRLGLSEYFRGEAELAETFNQVENGEHLVTITAGKLPPNPTELLSSNRMDQFLNQLREEQTYVIIDTPPLTVSDPVVLTNKVDGVLLVVESGSTKISALKSSIELLERTQARVIGIVLNNISKHHSHYYGNGYRSSYYHSKEEE